VTQRSVRGEYPPGPVRHVAIHRALSAAHVANNEAMTPPVAIAVRVDLG